MAPQEALCDPLRPFPGPGRQPPDSIVFPYFQPFLTGRSASWVAGDSRGGGDLGRVDDSIGLYRTALALAPGTPAALANLGFALRDRGDYTEGDATSPFIPRLLPFSH